MQNSYPPCFSYWQGDFYIALAGEKNRRGL